MEFALPEVLDMIFGFLEIEDVMNCRLVSNHWHKCTWQQLDKRVALKLEDRNSNGGEESMEQAIESIHNGEFKNFIMVKSFPAMFESLNAFTLTSLCLKDISFRDLNDVRRILFKAFSSMKEVGLINVVISDEPIQGPALQVLGAEVPKVKVLRIERQNTRYLGGPQDLFAVWGFSELMEYYSPSVKQLDLLQGIENRHNIWQTLQLNGVCLKSLKYADINTRVELENWMSCMESIGEDLMCLDINLPGFHAFFRDYGVRAATILRSLRVVDMKTVNWSHCPEYEFTLLKHLKMGERNWTSFSFLTNMPSLKIVEMRIDDTQQLEIQGSIACVNVQKLVLTAYNGLKLTAHSRMFPNVAKVTLQHVAGSLGFDVLETVSEAWPNLRHLEICGRGWLPYLCAGNAVDADGNDVPPQTLQDRVNLIGLGTESRLEFPHLARFTQLVSFVHNDSYSTCQILYGDYSGTQVFMNMPSLRTLKLGYCNMSPEVLDVLKSRLVEFSFTAREFDPVRFYNGQVPL